MAATATTATPPMMSGLRERFGAGCAVADAGLGAVAVPAGSDTDPALGADAAATGSAAGCSGFGAPATSAPHPGQNLDPSGSSLPHLEQNMATSHLEPSLPP